MPTVIQRHSLIAGDACVIERAKDEIPVFADGEAGIPRTGCLNYRSGKQQGGQARLELPEQTLICDTALKCRRDQTAWAQMFVTHQRSAIRDHIVAVHE